MLLGKEESYFLYCRCLTSLPIPATGSDKRRSGPRGYRAGVQDFYSSDAIPVGFLSQAHVQKTALPQIHETRIWPTGRSELRPCQANCAIPASPRQYITCGLDGMSEGRSPLPQNSVQAALLFKFSVCAKARASWKERNLVCFCRTKAFPGKPHRVLLPLRCSRDFLLIPTSTMSRELASIFSPG